jgi:hypothetical protein
MTDTWSETHRHQCEVRDLLAKRVTKGRSWLHDHLVLIEKSRGKKARAQLERDIMDQWHRGNRGQAGCWFDATVV